MDVRRVRTWDWLAGLAGLILFVDLFMPWYGSEGLTANAWDSFAWVDLFLALAALMAMAILLVSAFARPEAVPKLLAAATFWVALIAAILVVIRLIKVPGGVDIVLTGGSAHIGRQWGSFVGTIVAIGLVVCVWRARQDMVATRPLRAQARSGPARES